MFGHSEETRKNGEGEERKVYDRPEQIYSLARIPVRRDALLKLINPPPASNFVGGGTHMFLICSREGERLLTGTFVRDRLGVSRSEHSV